VVARNWRGYDFMGNKVSVLQDVKGDKQCKAQWVDRWSLSGSYYDNKVALDKPCTKRS